MVRSLPIAAFLVLAAQSPLSGQAHPAAHARETLGTVHFPTSCKPAVAPQFDRAVAFLHSFEFRSSIEGFNGVLAADSTCAMAHWGIALSRWSNPMAAGLRAPAQLQRGQESVDAAMRFASNATERERQYIAAVAKLYGDYEHLDQRTRVVAYERAMRDLVGKQPADTEAKIFHALALTISAPPTDKTYRNQIEAGRILEPLWSAMPDHPGLAHYIIHSYDAPPLAARAKRAAHRYAEIAPSAAHALHMPSHIFTRLGMWHESVETNLRSMEASRRDSAAGEGLHGADYAVYAWLQMRQLAKAKAMLDELPSRAARFNQNPMAITGAAPASAGFFALAAIPARYALERHAWREAAALVPRATPFPWTEAMTYFARALGASHTGDLALARTSIDSLAAIQARLSAKGEDYWVEQVGIQTVEARAWLDLAEHRPDSAVARMREAVAREGATEKSAVTPGPLAPAREQLGDMLMALGRRKEALAEYRGALVSEPGRYWSKEGVRRAGGRE